MSELKNIIVVGGSGNVGREILAALIDNRDEFGTIAALKREGVPASDVLKGLDSRGVLLIEANYKDKATLVAAFKGTCAPDSTLILGFDVVISTVNVPAFEDQYTFLDAAIEAK